MILLLQIGEEFGKVFLGGGPGGDQTDDGGVVIEFLPDVETVIWLEFFDQTVWWGRGRGIGHR